MKTRVEQAFESERAETKMFEAYPRLVQALRNLAGMVPSVGNAYVWIEYRRTARGLLFELGEGEAVPELLPDPEPIPEFLRAKAPSELRMLAAVIVGPMIGAAGYRPGVMVWWEEAAEDALGVAREIIKQTGGVQS